jgi:hypothetical protein
MILKSKRGEYLHTSSDELRSPEFKEKRRLWIERQARAAQELLPSDLFKGFQVINL